MTVTIFILLFPMGVPLPQHYLLESLPLFYWIISTSLWTSIDYICLALFGNSLLFHWSIYIIYLYCSFLMIVTSWQVLRSTNVCPQSLFFFKMILLILSLFFCGFSKYVLMSPCQFVPKSYLGFFLFFDISLNRYSWEELPCKQWDFQALNSVYLLKSIAIINILPFLT